MTGEPVSTGFDCLTLTGHPLCAREGTGLFHKCHFIPRASPYRGHHRPHVTGEEAENQQGRDSLEVAEEAAQPGLESRT